MTNYLYHSNLPLTIPHDVAKCPYCDSDLSVVAITEYEVETGIPTETGVEIDCNSFDIDSDDNHNYPFPYVYWHPVIEKVTQWIRNNYVWCN
jgi:hypothetical protein